MQPRFVIGFTLVTLLAGCTALPGLEAGAEEPDGMSRALGAAARGDYTTAITRLEYVYGGRLPDGDRREALLALAALDLDPRNRAGRPSRATYRLANFLRSAAPAGDPDRPLAETLYLLALETGAPPSVADDGSRPLPGLDGPSLAAQLFRAEARRDSLRRRLHTVEQRLRARTRRLADAERELARIRALLRR